MAKPLIAIVGRPNVGKSVLFNRIAGKRLSIVDDTPGVTRDRLYASSDWSGREFDMVDTGGIEPAVDSEILQFMREQAVLAIDTADVSSSSPDITTGVTAADQEVAGMLLRSKKPVVLAVNKMDSTGPVNPDIYELLQSRSGRPPSPCPPSTVTAPGTSLTSA
jgi:GTP-binding protein